MPGIYMALDIAKRALLVQQTAFQVVGHNVANVNTPGFSRQNAVLEPSNALPSPIGPMGSGVDFTKISRAFDKYVETQLNRETEELGKWTAKGESFDRIEAIFNESSGYGLNNAMNEFWNAWQDVANAPSGKAERFTLITKGEILAGTLNELYSSLRGLQEDLDDRISDCIEEINTIAGQIAEINATIPQAEVAGSEANDSRDTRNNLLNELSEMININYYENPDGTVTVLVGEGKLLVEGRHSWNLQGEANSGNRGLVDVKWDAGNGVTTDITGDISGGEISGWLELRDVTIEDYMSRLDTLANEMIEEVNTLHSGGAGLDGYSDLTGIYAVADPDINLNAELTFTSQAGSFIIEVMDSTETVVNTYTINVDPTSDSLNALVTNINNQLASGGTELIAEATVDGELRIQTSVGFSDHSFVFTSDSSGTLMALGVNTFFSGNDAFTIAVNPIVGNDTNKIAAATSSNSRGDNTNALAIAGLKDSLLMESGTSTLGDYYSSLVSEIGVESRETSGMSNHQEAMLEQLEKRKSSVSGVSLDEEMINLMKYQNAYMSAARIVTLVDEMLDALIRI